MLRILFFILTSLTFTTSAHAVVDIQVIETPNGINAWLVEDHSFPFVALEIYFPNGSSSESAAQSGATYLMTSLLDEGAGDLDAVDFQIAVRNIGARFAFQTYKQAINVSAKMVTENRDESVELLKLVLSQPRFEQDDFERVKNQLLTDLKFYSTDQDEIGVEAFHGLLFGEHPFHRRREGSLETVETLTRDDIIATHARALTKQDVVVGVSGDITKEELVLLLDNLFNDLPDQSPVNILPVEIARDKIVEIVDFPNPQSLILFGHEGLGRKDQDFLAAYVLNQVFGQSGFNSRLLNKLRVELGLTYGVGSYLSSYQDTGLITGSMQTANETVAQAIETIRDEWSRIANEGITQEELDTIKRYLTGAYPLRFDTNESIAAILVSMLWEDMPPDYVKERNGLVDSIDLETINRVARELFHPDQLTFVVVGQPPEPELL
ncbi:MAG: pitrilysin family protein [Rhodobacteraceae bacterium]|nr:pitrilysin family protein [Paracoccaceae bacterium]